MRKKIVAIGQVFGQWTVIEEVETDPRTRLFLCQCSCGNRKAVRVSHLMAGCSRSCGCLQKSLARTKFTTHGLNAHPLYSLWNGIRRRCLNHSAHNYGRYGGRGIAMFYGWAEDPQAFIEYVESTLGEKPGAKYSLDRINNERGYEPGNLRWANGKTQANNMRNNVVLTCAGVTKNLTEWAEELGVSSVTLRTRYGRGWADEEILSTPIKKRNKSQTG